MKYIVQHDNGFEFDCSDHKPLLQTAGIVAVSAIVVKNHGVLSFLEFQQTKRERTPAEYENIYGADMNYTLSEPCTIMAYCNGLYIEKYPAKYCLVLDNSYYESKDLLELEVRLWDWYMWDCGSPHDSSYIEWLISIIKMHRTMCNVEEKWGDIIPKYVDLATEEYPWAGDENTNGESFDDVSYRVWLWIQHQLKQLTAQVKQNL